MEQTLAIPSKELLDSTHHFPGPYIFKAIGPGDSEFLAETVSAVRETLGLEKDPPFHSRQTSEGKHIALTFELLMESSDKVIQVYQAILKVKGLLLLL